MTTLQHKHMRELFAYVANESPLCEVILQYVMTSLYACHLIGYGQDVTWYQPVFYWLLSWGTRCLLVSMITPTVWYWASFLATLSRWFAYYHSLVNLSTVFLETGDSSISCFSLSRQKQPTRTIFCFAEISKPYKGLASRLVQCSANHKRSTGERSANRYCRLGKS